MGVFFVYQTFKALEGGGHDGKYFDPSVNLPNVKGMDLEIRAAEQHPDFQTFADHFCEGEPCQ